MRELVGLEMKYTIGTSRRSIPLGKDHAGQPVIVGYRLETPTRLDSRHFVTALSVNPVFAAADCRFVANQTSRRSGRAQFG
jgi:hypothetical protein